MNYSYSYTPTRGPKRRLPNRRIVIITITILALGTFGYWFLQRGGDPSSNTAVQTAAVEKSAGPQPTAVAGKYLFSGTIVLARAVERAAKTAGGYDYNQPFSGLDTFNPAQYDAWAADLECPVTTNTVSYEQQVANLVFNCRPEFLPSMLKYISIVSLANNHSSDMGSDGFLETQQHLEKAGLQSYGNYNPGVAKDVCEIIALPVRVKKTDGSEQKGTLPMAFCAWHYFFRSPLPGEMEVMERYAKIMPVFGFMHAGVEYLATAGVDQVNIAHKIIDLGGEFVIGNSPHWVQNAEVYKGKPIFYSTGNFIFDQIDYETQRGLNVDVAMEVPYDENLAKWLALGEQCKALADTCLEEAEKQGFQIRNQVNLRAGGQQRRRQESRAAGR